MSKTTGSAISGWAVPEVGVYPANAGISVYFSAASLNDFGRAHVLVTNPGV
jgi:hypothetical protein